MVALQIHPEVGSVAEQFAESDSHLGRDRLFLVQNIVERLPGDSEGGRHCRLAHAYRRKNILSEYFARMRWYY